jgi:predicted oxidoreductase
MASNANKLKFPILESVDYLDLVKNKATLKTYSKKDLEGKKWRDLQIMIGKEFGGGVFYYNYKQTTSDMVYRGTVRAIHSMINEIKDNKENNLNDLEMIKKQIASIGQSNGVSVDLLISIIKQSYEMRINFLNDELRRKQNFIEKLEKQIDDLNDQLDNADLQIEDLKSKTGINQYLEIAQSFLKAKTLKSAPVATLKDSDPADIPAEILKILGAVDWSKVSPEILNTIVMYLNMYIDKLPLKQS